MTEQVVESELPHAAPVTPAVDSPAEVEEIAEQPAAIEETVSCASTWVEEVIAV